MVTMMTRQNKAPLMPRFYFISDRRLDVLAPRARRQGRNEMDRATEKGPRRRTLTTSQLAASVRKFMVGGLPRTPDATSPVRSCTRLGDCGGPRSRPQTARCAQPYSDT